MGRMWQIMLGVLAMGGVGVARAADTAPMTPENVVATYLLAAHENAITRDMPIYSAATREMMRGLPLPTPAMNANEVRSYMACAIDRTQIAGNYAVVRYRLKDYACAPFFLVREEGAWRLDLTVMRDLIRFNTANRWHLAPGARSPYAFAFQDWQFDRNGYAVGARSSAAGAGAAGR